MENNQNINEATEPVSTEVDYIKIIEELKANTVPIEKHMKVLENEKRLANALARGETLAQEKTAPKETPEELRKALYGNGCDGLSNLDYWDKTMKLREAIIESGKEDPFVPQGHNIVATEEDRAAAQRVADVIQYCIDVAEGDSSVFTNELQRHTADVNMLKPRRK